MPTQEKESVASLSQPSLSSPKVAFLMSVYDREKATFLQEAVESMLQQTYSRFDIHIFKDGPLGGELDQMLDRYAAQYPHIILHQRAINRGLAVSLNEMILKLYDDYTYFARMDSDDICLPERLEKQVQFMEITPGVDVVGGSVIDVDEYGKEIKRAHYPLSHDAMRRFFYKRNPVAHVTVMYRKTFFEKAGLYPPVSYEDGLYWMQGFCAGCRFQNIPEFLVKLRRTDDFLKRRSGFKVNLIELKIKLRICRRLKFGLSAYFYAFVTFFAQMMPVPVKRVLYDVFR